MDHETREEFKELMQILKAILAALKPQRFTIAITQVVQESNNMKITKTNPARKSAAIGGLSSPGSATLNFTLLDQNGNPYVVPAGSTYVFNPTVSADDPNVTLTENTSNATPQVFVSIPPGDPSAQVTFSATATDPDGNTATGTLSIPLSEVTQTFTIEITQVA
jgi:hypothetical protein